jgi:tripartite-type tricarboxylate transporter receptor subunit TctC
MEMREEIKKQAIFELCQGILPMKEGTIWRRSFPLAILILVFLSWNQVAEGQDYPRRPITLLINMAAGGATDICARIIAQGATKILGQEVVPVNRTGGGGSVATGILANSTGDGYTIMAGPSPALTNVPHLELVAYDPLKDIIPIIQYGVSRDAIIVRSDSPYNSLKDLIDFARKNPGKASCGHAGVGTTLHLVIEYLNMEEQVNITAIPFQGSTPAITALLGGHITAVSAGPAFYPYFKSGKVKVLAANAEKRLKDVNVPTLLELGYTNTPTSDLMIFAAPKGTAPAVVEKLEQTFRKVMGTQEYRTLAEDTYQMYAENPLSTQNLKDVIEKIYARNGEIIRKAKLGK